MYLPNKRSSLLLLHSRILLTECTSEYSKSLYSRIHIRIRHPVFAIRIVFVTWCIRSSPSIYGVVSGLRNTIHVSSTKCVQLHYSHSILPRLLLQGAAPCPLFVTPCPFEKAEMTPCPFDYIFFFWNISHTRLLALFFSFCCPHTAWIVLCIFYWAIQGHF